MNDIMKYFNEIKNTNPTNYHDIIMEFVSNIKGLKQQKNKILTFMILDFVHNNPDIDRRAYKILEAAKFQIRKLKDEDVEYIENSFVDNVERIAFKF
ncbi:hypothetical protein ACWG0P_10955 [Amedibacillus sp. YH-ame6]